LEPRWAYLVTVATIVLLLALACSRRGEAATRFNGNFFLEETYAKGPEGDSSLFQGGLNLDIRPPTKKKLEARLSIRLNYTRSDKESLLNVSPVGNLGIDLSGAGYALNVNHSRFATISSAAQLTETSISRASLSLYPADLPRVTASVSRTESATGGTVTRSDYASFFGDYRYKWMNFRGLLSTDTRATGDQPEQRSDSVLLGAGGSYQVLPKTTLTGDVDFNRFSSESAAGFNTVTVGTTYRLSADTRPFTRLWFTGNFVRTTTDFDSPTATVSRTIQQFSDITGNLDPYPSFRFSTTVGNRRFNDAETFRSVDFTTYAATFHKRVRDGVLLGVVGSRSLESDPAQGKNITDNFGVNTTMDVTPRFALRLNFNVNRSEVRSFVSTKGFDASGTPAERVNFDDRPRGFTFFDLVNNDLYTKASNTPGDWTLTAHIEPITEKYSITKSAQVNAVVTDRTNLAFTYSSSASADGPDIGKTGSQSLNASLTYLANRRTNYGFTGTVSLPESGADAYSLTGTMAYRFSRGHHMSLNYGVREAAGTTDHTMSGTLGLIFRKRVSLELTYAGTKLYTDERTDFLRVRFSKSF
jgi:hypothetical protein